MKIEVKPEHIFMGIPRDPCRCMVALAVRAILPYKIIYVYEEEESKYTIEIDIFGETYQRYLLPEEVSEQIKKFDDRRSVSPFSFELEVESNEDNSNSKEYRPRYTF